MAETVGWQGLVNVGGTSTAFTNEATTMLGGANFYYQITSATKRVIDPTVAVVVEEDTGGGYAPVSPTSFDYYRGIAYFAVARTGTIRFSSGNYIPLLTLAPCHVASMAHALNMLDISALDDATGMRVFIAGLRTLTASVEVHEDIAHDYDSGAGTRNLGADLLAKTRILLEVQLDGTNEKAWAWGFLTSAEAMAPVDGVAGSSYEFQSSPYGSETNAWKWATASGV